MCKKTGAQALSKGKWPMGNGKRQQGTLECFGIEVRGVREYYIPAGSPPTASAHTSATGYV